MTNNIYIDCAACTSLHPPLSYIQSYAVHVLDTGEYDLENVLYCAVEAKVMRTDYSANFFLSIENAKNCGIACVDQLDTGCFAGRAYVPVSK